MRRGRLHQHQHQAMNWYSHCVLWRRAAYPVEWLSFKFLASSTNNSYLFKSTRRKASQLLGILVENVTRLLDPLPLCIRVSDFEGGTSFVDILCFCSVLCLLCLCERLFICDLWSPAGKGLTSWLSFVVSNCEFDTFPLVSWVRCGT